jgi:cytochrome P450
VPYDDRDRFRSWTDAFMSVSAVPMEDLSRPPTPHLAFGHGTHHCTGAQLARMELQVGLRALLDRCPELRLAGDAQPRWKVGMVIRGPQALPIAW